MNEQDELQDRAGAPAEEWGIGAEMKRLLDEGNEGVASPFDEAELLASGIEDGPSCEKHARGRIMSRFFHTIGLDYDAWRGRKSEQRRRRLIRAGTLATIAVGVAVVAWAVLRMVAGYGIDGKEKIEYFDHVEAIQPRFSVSLPEQPPAGFQLAEVALERGAPAGPRAVISYERAGTTTTAETVDLLVRPLADEPFVPSPAAREPLEIAGQAALWVEGSGEIWSSQLSSHEGGWVVWEQGEWRFALVSNRLSRGELVEIVAQLLGE
jgi:hypothetical protein